MSTTAEVWAKMLSESEAERKEWKQRAERAEQLADDLAIAAEVGPRLSDWQERAERAEAELRERLIIEGADQGYDDHTAIMQDKKIAAWLRKHNDSCCHAGDNFADAIERGDHWKDDAKGHNKRSES